MTPQDMKVLVFGENVWGRADTLQEALRKACNPKYYLAFIVHPETCVTEMGSISWPQGYAPKEIIRKDRKRNPLFNEAQMITSFREQA